MKFKLTAPALFATLLFSLASYAQDTSLLSAISKGREAFIASEPNLRATISWLEHTPIGRDPEKRRQQNAMLLAWISDSPTVTVELNTNVMPFGDNNGDLMFVFMGGWARWMVANNYSRDKVQGTIAGLKSAFATYALGGDVKKANGLERIMKLSDADLEQWVRKQLGKKS